MKTKNIEEILQIIVITYNRADYLESTLLDLTKTPFINCDISVFNNASTDHTVLVCEDIQKQGFLKNLTLKTHEFNIGCNANILLALQSVSSKYLWILCDDDKIMESGWEDVVEVLCTEQADCIMLSHMIAKEGRGKFMTYKDIISSEIPYFASMSFLPNNIVSAKLIKQNISQCSMFCAYCFPHLALHIFAPNDIRYYSSKNYLLQQGIEANSLSFYYPLDLYWLRVCDFISDKFNRKNVVKQWWTLQGYKTPLKQWGYSFLQLNVSKKKSFSFKFRVLLEMFLLSSNYGRLFVIILSPLLFFPSKFLNLIYYLYKKKNVKIRQDESRGSI